MVEQETQRRFPEVVSNHLENELNQFLLVRFLEICTVLDYLQKEGILKEENLKGKIIDLGTGSGIGLLALRQFSCNGELIGVDNQEAWNDLRNSYTGGFYKIPQSEIIKAASAKFERFNILDFVDLYYASGEQPTLITGFYANVARWVEGLPNEVTGIDYEKGLPLVFDHIGEILPPGGQLIITSVMNMKHPCWARERQVLIGRSGENHVTLELPFPKWLKERYWDLMCREKENPDSRLSYFLEDEIFETEGEEIGLIRDMTVRVFTK